MNDEPNGFIPYPTGWLKTLFRLPLYVHRLGLGILMRLTPFLVLTTRGRKSGQPRHVVLEYRRHGSNYYIVSGWGERPHWYKNLREDPQVTVQIGDNEFRACAYPVENPSEALRALYMFRRKSPLYEIILASMSSAETIDLRTLTEVSDEFTVVRLESEPGAAQLPGVQPVNPWLRPLILGSTAVFFAWQLWQRLRR